MPSRTQLDGTEFQASNCGPASLGMVLDAFGVTMPNAQIRFLSNNLQGTFDQETGIALDYLGEIGRMANLRTYGLKDGSRYRRWSVDDLRAEIRRGHPVITLVKMRELPDYEQSRAETDHYVVIVGIDGNDLLMNDSARAGDLGLRRRISPSQLERAWDASSIPRHSLAFGAPAGITEAQFGGASAAPQSPVGMALPPINGNAGPTTNEPPRMMLPRMVMAHDEAASAHPPPPFTLNTTDIESSRPPALGQPAVLPQSAMPLGASNALVGQPVLVYVTPASQPQPIIVNVQIPAQSAPLPQVLVTPTPMPTRQRWARPEVGLAPSSAPLISPSANLGTGDTHWPITESNVVRSGSDSDGPSALVLGQTGPPPVDLFWRWFIRIGMIAGGGVFLRRLWR